LKAGIYSVFYIIISNGAVVLCFVPFFILGWKNMRTVRTWCVLGIYWLLTGLVNLLGIWFSSHPNGSHGMVGQLSFGYSLVETPLLLLAFALAKQGRGRRVLLLILLLFLTGESILLRLRGNNSLLLIMGSGLAIIILYSLTGLLGYLKKMEHTRLENSMVFIYASLLFSYGSTLIIYIFAHYHHAGGANGNDMDSFLLYYVSLLLSAVITCAGLWSYGIRRSRPRHWSAASGYSSSSS
jgi:hypothetical protein